MKFATEGEVTDPGGRFAIVASRFNQDVVKALVAGAQEALAKHGVDVKKRVDLVWVPGAFEIPLVSGTVARTGDYAAVIALAAVIRGETPHFDAIVHVVSTGVAAASANSGIPVIFGVLTTDTLEQAWARAGKGGGNKGYDAGLAALEMVRVMQLVGR